MKPQSDLKNERAKHAYMAYLREAKGCGEAVIDAALAAIHRFEGLTKYRDFSLYHPRQASAFKNSLGRQIATGSKDRLSAATRRSILAALKAFYSWLSSQAGYRKLTITDADYFNPSNRDEALANASRPRSPPTFEQIRHVIKSMPDATDIERWDRAVLAFIALTGIRDNAVASLHLGDVDIAERKVTLDARYVRTKFSKSGVVSFFPVGDDFREIVEEWVRFLREHKLWGLGDPLFPATETIVGREGGFMAAGLKRQGWKSANTIRAIFRTAFERVGLPYFNPHLVRHTLTHWGEKHCRSPEEFKAFSQNLGHENVMTTFTSYGTLPPHRQAEVIRTLGSAART